MHILSWRMLGVLSFRAHLLFCSIRTTHGAAHTRSPGSVGILRDLCPEVEPLHVATVAPELRALHPDRGPLEGGTSLTIAGSGFSPYCRLEVKILSLSPDVQIDSLPATFIDTTTITVLSPPRKRAHVAQVQVMADAQTCSNMTAVTEPSAQFEFTYASSSPSGIWDLKGSPLSSQGNEEVTILPKEALANRQINDNMISGISRPYCASGVSTRHIFSHFTEVTFQTKESSTKKNDRMLHIMPVDANNYDFTVQSNLTYEIVVVSFAGQVHWRWRKWLTGTEPSGIPSKLLPFSTLPVRIHHGVTIRFATATGKHVGDTWRFDSVSRNQFRVQGKYVSGNIITCRLPPPDTSYSDAKPDYEGMQQEIKVSVSGRVCFSKPIYRHISVLNSLSSASMESASSQDFEIGTDGYFTGPEDYSFEIVMTSSTTFKWRKYRPGMSTCTITGVGPWCRFVGQHNIESGRAIYLQHGVFVKFATTNGKTVGDQWEFTAFTCWSTSFSPVKFRGRQLTSNEDALLVVEGAFVGAEDVTFEVETLADPSMFRWRYYARTSNYNASEWTETWRTRMVSTSPLYLEQGVSIYWLTTGGKYFGDRWNWKAFSGHLVTTLAKPHASAILPSNTNIPGDPAVPYVFGTYLGQERVRFVIEIGGNCSTSCFEFRWKIEHLPNDSSYQTSESRGLNFSVLYGMKDPQPLTDGLYISWVVTTGYAHGNTYTITVSQIPTSVLPVRPAQSSLFSSIISGSSFSNGPHGESPAKSSVLTIEFWNSSAFKWRKDTEPYSKCISVVFNRPVHITGGVSIIFSSKIVFAPGVHYLIPLQSHIPHVFNVESEHHGVRVTSTISRPEASLANLLNGPNYGSVVGDVIPQMERLLPIDRQPDGKILFQQNDVIVQNNCIPDQASLTGITASATRGHVTERFPAINLKIVGDPTLSNVLGEPADEIEVLGKYSGMSSYVYEIETYGPGDHFIWRKYPFGSNDVTALWSQAYRIQISSSSPLDHNLSVLFNKPLSEPVSSNKRWIFTAHQGHTFVFRISGRATWSEEKAITGRPQELASGISVQFSQLSGYSSGNRFMISNRTVDTFGTYFGAEDAEFTVRIAGQTKYDLPIFHPSSLGNTSGPPAIMTITGTYTGMSTYVYEILIVEGIRAGLSSFTWRKFPLGHKDGGGPYHRCRKMLALSPIELEAGIFISWVAISGQSEGDIWRFTAHAGDTFQWRRQNSEWSPHYRITNVGLVMPDENNINSQANQSTVLAIGEYEGSTDATFVVEILRYRDAFRWKKDVLLLDCNGVAMNLSYSRGNENVVFDSGLNHAMDKEHACKYGNWSPAISIALSNIFHLMEGVHVVFTKLSGLAHGDLFYIPVKSTRHHELDQGINIVFGSDSGYSPGDQWHFKATSAIAARGPLAGNTGIVIRGAGFLNTPALRCKLSDTRTMYTMTIPAQYISPWEVRCTTNMHPPNTITDPEPIGFSDRALHAHGTFGSIGSAIIDVRMNSSTRFQWQARAMNSTKIFVNWSSPEYISPGTILPVFYGVAIRFSRSETYFAGDSWSISAYANDRLSLAAYYQTVWDDSMRPGIMKYVSVSLDGGATWAAEQNGLTRFLFSDIHVSSHGNDITGVGTFSLPYQTLQQAINAALSFPKTSMKTDLSPRVNSNSTLNLVNRDNIVMHPGQYTGVGNSGLFVGMTAPSAMS